MSQDESLRLVAEVQDKFIGPLGNLKRMMADLANAGAGHNDTLEKGFGKVTGGVRAAESAVASGLNPALRTLGVTSLTVTGAVLGVGAALKSFASGGAALGQLARDTGIGAQTLREVQGILGKVGVDAATSGQALQQFAEAARLAHRGYGPLVTFLRQQGTSAEGRAYFNGLADSIIHSKDAGDALMKALKGMEGIKGPNAAVERRIYAENVLKMADAARLADGHLGSIDQQLDKFRKVAGVLSPQDIERAERYNRALGDIGSTMSKVGTVIASELLGPAEGLASWLAEIVSSERSEGMKALRDGLGGIKKELDGINWRQAGEDSLAFLRESTALAGTLAKAFHEVAEAMHAMRDGDWWQVLRRLDGAQGPTAQRLAPQAGDDVRDAQNKVTSWRKALAEAEIDPETGGPAIDFKSREPYLKQQLAQAEKHLQDLQNRTPEQKERDESNDKLRRSLDALAERMREQGATVQKQSFDGGDGSGGATTVGALIQKASLGGGGARGGYGGQTLGERLFGHPTGSAALGDPYREKRMQALLADPSAEWRMRIARGERGVPLPGGGGGTVDIGEGMRGRPFGAPAAGSGADCAGQALRGGGGDGLYGSRRQESGAGRAGRALRGEDGPLAAKYPPGLADGIRQSASDLGISARDLATAISYETGGTFDPWKRGPTTKWGVHRGLIQWGEPQQVKYGVTKDMAPGDQMKAVTRYLRDAGVRPGMGLPEIYSAINAGRVGRMGASDRPGYTVSRHVAEMRGPHGRRADALLGAKATPTFADALRERANTNPR